jgi:hypothetical protein
MLTRSTISSVYSALAAELPATAWLRVGEHEFGRGWQGHVISVISMRPANHISKVISDAED